MTHERDFDRIARAWLDLGPNEAPDRAVDAVLQALVTVPQVRRPFRWPFWRPAPMSRLPVLAVLAGLIIIIVGAVALTSGSPPSEPAPSSAAPSAPAVVASPIQGPPDGLVGGWTGRDRTLLFGALDGNESAPDFSVGGPAFTPNLRSVIEAPEPGLIRLTLEGPSPECEKGDVGTYRWSTVDDGEWLAIEALGDVCGDRLNLLHGGRFQRELSVDSHGGPGIATQFLPYIEFTLPEGTFIGAGSAETDTIHTESADSGFKVWKDLDGFVDPCDLEAGRLDLDPGMDALLAYLTEDPRFRVTSQDEFEIDGHRAVELLFTVGESIAAPCWPIDGTEDDPTAVLTWVPHGGGPGGYWAGEIGGDGMLVVTEVDGVTLAFEPIEFSGDEWVVDRDVLETVRFHDALPAPPAS